MGCQRGVVTRVSIHCSVCGKEGLVTDPYGEQDAAVNNRSVVAMRTIGKGQKGLETFAGFIATSPIHAYSAHTSKYLDGQLFQECLQQQGF